MFKGFVQQTNSYILNFEQAIEVIDLLPYQEWRHIKHVSYSYRALIPRWPQSRSLM